MVRLAPRHVLAATPDDRDTVDHSVKDEYTSAFYVRSRCEVLVKPASEPAFNFFTVPEAKRMEA